MFSACHAALMSTLGRQFVLSKSRLLTLAVLIIGLTQSRTVNLTHLASHFPGDATHASAYRRLQRFFQFVRLDTDRMAQLVVHMLNLERPKCLALDRTNWKIGSTDVNILVLAIVTRRFRVPLLWSFSASRQFRHRPAHRADAALSRPVSRCLDRAAHRRPGVRRHAMDDFPQ
jgi:hypothetical protein